MTKFKNKQSFLGGITYAAGILGIEGFTYLKEEGITAIGDLPDEVLKEIVDMLAFLVCSYGDEIQAGDHWKGVGVEFEG